jgi:DNA-3-methyladenine glycosylase I
MPGPTPARDLPAGVGRVPPLPRCSWAGDAGAHPDALMVAYHDHEWGVPVDDDRELFERLALEGFQAGLSWATILRKRPAFRAAFTGFDPVLVAGFGPDDRARLLADAGIVRNRAKIEATIANARALGALQAAEGPFAGYLRRFVAQPGRIQPADATLVDLPARTAESDALSRDLRRRGFSFAGSTIVYAFMQSVGLVDDHLPGCFRYRG